MPLSSTAILTRARCVLDKSRRTLLARWADSISGVQMTRFKTLVRTLILAPVRRLSRDMLHKEASVFSTSSMRTIFPAQGKRITGPLAVSFVMLVSHYFLSSLLTRSVFVAACLVRTIETSLVAVMFSIYC